MNNKTNTLEKDFNQYVLVEEKQVELYDGSKKTENVNWHKSKVFLLN